MTETNPLNELLSNYPYGSLYVTYIPLHDLKYLLSDSRKLPQIKQITSQPDSVDTLAGFLNNYGGKRLNEGIAFLHLDLNILKAGFKRISDLDAVLQLLPWSAAEVQGIAEVCDLYIKKVPTFEEVDVSMRSGKVSLVQAWKGITKLEEEPFFSGMRHAGLVGKFKELLDEKPYELEAMKYYDMPTYQSIKSLTNVYDTYLAKQRDEPPLAKLLKTELNIVNFAEEFEKARRNRDTMLTEGKVLACMKNSSEFLEKFGLDFEALPTSEMFEVRSRLNAPLIRKSSSSRSTLRDIVSLDSDLLGGGKGGFGGSGNFGSGGIGGGGGGGAF